MLKRIFTIDLRSLALFRIALAAVLVVDLIDRARTLGLLYTDGGVFSRSQLVSVYGRSMKWTSLHFYTGGSVGTQALMFFVALLIALALMVGYRTWFATVLSWILFVSLNRRMPHAAGDGADVLVRLMLLWSMFLPLGARWSVDRWRGAVPQSRHASDRLANFATAAILLQVAYVYWFTVAWKWSPVWLDGTALGHAMRLDLHARRVGQWLSRHESLCFFLTYATLATELLAPIIAFFPWRNAFGRMVAVVAMLGLHVGIAVCVDVGLFPYISIMSWLLFLPSEFWDGLSQRFPALRETGPGELNETNWEPNGTIVATVAVVLLFAIVTAYNCLGLPQVSRAGVTMPASLDRVAKTLRVDQKWRMFAEPQRTYDGWFAMPMLLSDGSTVDAWTGATQPPFPKSKVPSADYPSARVRKLMGTFCMSPQAPIWPGIANYYAKEWDRQHPGREVERMRIVFFYEREHGQTPQPVILVEIPAPAGQK